LPSLLESCVPCLSSLTKHPKAFQVSHELVCVVRQLVHVVHQMVKSHVAMHPFILLTLRKSLSKITLLFYTHTHTLSQSPMKLSLTFRRPRFLWLKKVYILWARIFYIKKHTTLIEKHGRFGGSEIPPTFKSSSPHISIEVCVECIVLLSLFLYTLP